MPEPLKNVLCIVFSYETMVLKVKALTVKCDISFCFSNVTVFRCHFWLMTISHSGTIPEPVPYMRIVTIDSLTFVSPPPFQNPNLSVITYLSGLISNRHAEIVLCTQFDKSNDQSPDSWKEKKKTHYLQRNLYQSRHI